MKIRTIVIFFLIFITQSTRCMAGDSVLLFDHGENKILFSENINEPHIPASTLKVLTALYALEKLGLDYRFQADVFQDKNKNIYIKGYGDPLFISKEISRLAYETASLLKDKKKINSIYLDQSFFSPESMRFNGTSADSFEPYDASNNALAANFNSVCFERNGKTILSCEAETPIVKELLADIISSGLKSGRIPVTQKNSLLYPGYLLKYFLEENGIKIGGKIGIKEVPLKKAKKILSFQSSFTLKDILEKMLFYSNNFIANQLFLKCGGIIYGSPATIYKAKKAFGNYVKEKGIDMKVFEGSGISRKNRITAKEMLKVLNLFRKYYFMMKKKDNVYYKTGTLSDVRNMVGYIQSESGKLYTFIIFKSENNIDLTLTRLKKLIR